MMAQPDLMKKALVSVYNWASKKGYGPTYKPDKDNPKFVSAMKGEILLKVIIEDGKINVITAPKTPNLENEVIDMLGLDKEDDFEDEPLDLSGKEVEIVDAGQIDPEQEIKPAVQAKKPKSPAKRTTNTPAKKEYSDARRDLDIVRSQQKDVYEVAGRKALTSARISELINERGLVSQVIEVGRDEKNVWATVRVTDPKTGRYREDAKIIDRETFWILKALDIAANQQKKLGNKVQLLLSVKQNGEPVVNNEIILDGKPAGLWLYLQVLRSWSTADGFAITRAMSRAAMQILNQEWKDPDEIQTEKAEADAIGEITK